MIICLFHGDFHVFFLAFFEDEFAVFEVGLGERISLVGDLSAVDAGTTALDGAVGFAFNLLHFRVIRHNVRICFCKILIISPRDFDDFDVNLRSVVL